MSDFLQRACLRAEPEVVRTRDRLRASDEADRRPKVRPLVRRRDREARGVVSWQRVRHPPISSTPEVDTRKNAFRVAIGLGVVRGDGWRETCRPETRPDRNCKICGSEPRVRIYRRDADQPEARVLVVFIHDTCVVFVFSFFFLGFGFGSGQEKADLFAVMGPRKAADVALAFCERCGFAAIHGEKI